MTAVPLAPRRMGRRSEGRSGRWCTVNQQNLFIGSPRLTRYEAVERREQGAGRNAAIEKKATCPAYVTSCDFGPDEEEKEEHGSE